MVQAAIDGMFSSRKIDRLAQENVIYMYLAGNAKPDFRTLCNFRREHKELIETVFKKTVLIAKAAGVLQLGHLSTDGTKVKANASNLYTLRKEELETIRRIIEQGIAVDEEEDRLYGDRRGDELPPELNTPEKIRRKIKEIEEAQGKPLKQAAKKILRQHLDGDEQQKKQVLRKIKKAEQEITRSGQKAVSVSDPEARFMENKKKWKELSYNPQITVDHGSGIIVANDVTQDCVDREQLQPQMQKTEENLGGLPKDVTMSWDNGYYSGQNLHYLEGKGVDGYIPDCEQASKMKGKQMADDPYAKVQFIFDDTQDCFICPQGRMLTRKGEYEYNGKTQYAYYGAPCSECPVQSACAGKNKWRVITSDGYEAERKRMKAKMQSEQGKKEYRKRGETVEWPFGDIKQNLGLREFLTRGLLNVKTEHNLVCTAHNLKVMWRTVGRKTTILKSITVSLSSNICCSMESFILIYRKMVQGTNC
jgi:transposase